ncbi:MAG: large conductance mechanosensitive channel protein MscL [Actinobacteria bacterium HGW-Actinobacteria-7]|jgi:large conductance mechanosensitive channel|nr:MAG: large conductance mechanosensitive channel protein MscL [Actinobacteria bacterium HGW-Actinobacteria-7]
MLNEFKEFALKGNAITLAVGVVMGAAFNAIIASIVDNLFNPLLGVLLGGVDLNTRVFKVLGVTFGWGAVVAAIVNFVVVAIALFILVKFLSKLQKEADPTTRACPFCTTEIAKSATRCPACTSEVTAQS